MCHPDQMGRAIEGGARPPRHRHEHRWRVAEEAAPRTTLGHYKRTPGSQEPRRPTGIWGWMDVLHNEGARGGIFSEI